MNNFKKFEDLGLKVRISEMTVSALKDEDPNWY